MTITRWLVKKIQKKNDLELIKMRMEAAGFTKGERADYLYFIEKMAETLGEKPIEIAAALMQIKLNGRAYREECGNLMALGMPLFWALERLNEGRGASPIELSRTHGIPVHEMESAYKIILRHWGYQ